MMEGSDMLIVRFNQHVHIRLGEWLAAAILSSIGLLLISAHNMFDADLFAVMRQFAPQRVWGFSCFIVGVVRLCALYVNGRRTITPYIRMAMAFVSCFLWYNLALGVILSGIAALSLAMFPWLLALDVYNVFRASADAREVYDRKRALNDGTGQA